MTGENPYEMPASQPPRPSRWRRGLGWLAVAVVVGLVIVGLLAGGRRCAREAARRIACSDNMKRIGKALHAYHDEHGALPPACLRDAEGRLLHGWRTLLVAEFPVSRAVHWMAPENADEDLFARLEPAAEKSGQHMNRILTMLFADGHTESWYEDDFAAIDAAARRAFVSVSAEKPAIDS